LSVKLYTPGAMTTSGVNAVTHEIDGFEKEYLADSNPETYWYAGTAAQQDIIITVPESIVTPAINGHVLFIRNYADISAGTLTIYSSPAVAPSDVWTVRDAMSLVDTATPLRMIHSAATHDIRVWRYRFTGLNTTIHVGMVFPARVWELTINAQHPDSGTRSYHNTTVLGAGGREWKQQWNSAGVDKYQRQFVFDGATDWTAMKAAFDDCKGDLRPFVYSESTTQSEARLVRFGAPLAWNTLAYDMTQVTVQLNQVPYIPSGENF